MAAGDLLVDMAWLVRGDIEALEGLGISEASFFEVA